VVDGPLSDYPEKSIPVGSSYRKKQARKEERCTGEGSQGRRLVVPGQLKRGEKRGLDESNGNRRGDDPEK